MAASYNKQYWDSPVFISYLMGTIPERVDILEELLGMNERGKIHVVISTFVIAEVRSMVVDNAKTKPGQEELIRRKPYDPEHLAAIKKFFTSDELDYRPLTHAIAQRAADIGNEYPRLLPADCVHIATAEAAEVDVLFTWDGSRKATPPGRYAEV